MKKVKLFMLALLLSVCAFAQTEVQYYQLIAKNVTRVDTNTVTFDVYLARIGSDSIKLCYYDLLIGFDLQQCANGGTVAVNYVSNSSDTANLMTNHKSPTVVYDSANAQIRIYTTKTALGTKSKIATSTGTKLGKFRLVCSNPWVVASKLNLKWLPGSRIVAYINDDRTLVNITQPWRQYVLSNTALN